MINFKFDWPSDGKTDIDANHRRRNARLAFECAGSARYVVRRFHLAFASAAVVRAFDLFLGLTSAFLDAPD